MTKPPMTEATASLPANLAANPLLSSWVTIDAEGHVTVRSGKVELGQGVSTALAMIAARELGLSFDQMRFEAAATDVAPNEGYTAGSYSIEHGGSALRQACALVRALFADAAARWLGVDQADKLQVSSGVFAMPGSNEGVSYWQLRGDVDLAQRADALPTARPLGGTLEAQTSGLQRPDLPLKLSSAGFLQDLRRPHMHYGCVLRAAHPADRLVTFDVAAVRAQPGVRAVVCDGSFAGVVAERDEQAVRAIEVARRTATWQRRRELPAYATDPANDWMSETAVQASMQSTTFLDDGADAGAVPQPQPSALTHEAHYSRPYLAHASIGPSCAVAEWQAGRLSVWSHSQGIYLLRRQLAQTFGLGPEAVSVTHVPGAGCYGHNGADDVALDASLLAREAGVPVMCQWSRADELSWSPFGAAMRMALSADVDASGQIIRWRHQVWSPPHLARPGFGSGVNLLAAQQLATPLEASPDSDAARPQGGGDRNAVPLYDVGQRQITHHRLAQGPLRSSALRSLGAHGNVFAIESFLDELAARTKQDPVAFRLRHMRDPRGAAVIQAAAKLARWDGAAPLGDGVGRGLGFARYKNLGAYFAVVATVEVTDEVRLVSCHAAVDAGLVIHRDGLLNQIEGGLIQAASWTLKEAVTWTPDGFAQRSWDDYPILTLAQTPAIEITVIERPGEASLGAGECAAGPLAGAIANAVAQAVGVRVRTMPLTPEQIAAAIAAA